MVNVEGVCEHFLTNTKPSRVLGLFAAATKQALAEHFG